uniref:PD-(D/E)XK nuclease family protein n=1 Tax=Herbidospora sakaeratensis TaxID=564415 RepID=UPI0007C71DE2|nr:PD-(D/E)XK nuclease family protein [Herbidospora sakaeratensis]
MFTQPAVAPVNPPLLDGLAAQIAANVVGTIRHASANAPRSRQVAIGPSEIGTPCVRKLAYKLLDWDPKPNKDTDPLASVIGTAAHGWMEETFNKFNPTLPDGRPRYITEQRVAADATLKGSCDLFDRQAKTVIDWKFPGTTSMEKVRKNRDPGVTYRVQAHVYGLGYRNAGEDVEHVAVVFLPRAGRLDGVYVWTEPFQPQIALDALTRRDNVMKVLADLDPENNPAIWGAFPVGDAYCTYCPWHLPKSTNLARGCPGITN